MRKTFLVKSSKRFNYCSEATNAAEYYKKQTGNPADVARNGAFWHVSFYHLAETDLPVVPTDAELEYVGIDDSWINETELDIIEWDSNYWRGDSPAGALVGWGGGTYEEEHGDMNARDWGDGWDDFDGESWENYLGE